MIEGSGNHCKYGDQDGVIFVIYLAYSALKYAMETVNIISYARKACLLADGLIPVF